ncbi:MAG: hypothetical protein AAGI69_01890 [Cyanobacteria bacterium P01_H01_bin.21]
MPNSVPVRFATFNASLDRSNPGEPITDLSIADNVQAQAVATLVQQVNPDVRLLDEFDYDAKGEAIDLFRSNYLASGNTPVEYPYVIEGGVFWPTEGSFEQTDPGSPPFSSDRLTGDNASGDSGIDQGNTLLLAVADKTLALVQRVTTLAAESFIQI